MRHGHIPLKKYQDRRTMGRREDSRILAAERTAGAVQLQEHARLVQQQALSCELQQGHRIAHEALHPPSFTASDSLLSPLPSPLLHNVEDYNVDFSMDLDPILPPPGLVDINTQPGRGLPAFSIDNELIQQGETQFFPIPLDSVLPFIVKAQEDHHTLEEAGGALPLSPGRAFHLNAMEKQDWCEARKTREIAEDIERRMSQEIHTLMKASCSSDDEQDVVFGGDNSDLEDLGESGEEEIAESDVGTGCNGQRYCGSGVYNSDGDQWEEQLIDADYVLQEAQYSDVEIATPQAATHSLGISPSNPLPLPHPPSLQQSLYHLADSTIEIDTHQLKSHPKVIVNRLGENDPDHFLFKPQSRIRNNQWEAMDTKTNVIVFMISLLIASYVSYFQASRQQVAMLLKGIVHILRVAGCDDAAAHIPGCTDTVYSSLDIDTTTYLILPICPKCNDVYPPDPTGNIACPRCNIQLYPEDLGQPHEPKAMRQVHVPTYKLTMLLLSVQIEAFLNVQGIEADMDQWRSVGQPRNVYMNVTNAQVWNELLDHEGKYFFWTEEADGRRTGPNNEIRLGVHMAIDW